MNTKHVSHVAIIGAGLAGCEAALYLARRNVKVTLLESKRVIKTPAQKDDNAAELVCTNSLKSDQVGTGHGLLKEEMLRLGSALLPIASQCRVPAGMALAVDRAKFSSLVEQALNDEENINYISRLVDDPKALLKELGADYVIIATGPLTHSGLANWIKTIISGDDLYFYDAIAPVVDADTLDYDKLYFKDRWSEDESGKTGDYLNAPFTKEEYFNFIEALRDAQKVGAKDFEDWKFFESCLPIDLMAERGDDTARYSCLKPVGLKRTDEKLPYAVAQLRKENLLGDAFNLVGMQTRLLYPEQKRVFRLIPGLENAEFLHYGSVHRNSYLNANKILTSRMALKDDPQVYFAGQITGVEGYSESMASGLLVARSLLRKINGEADPEFPLETGFGAIVNYLMTQTKPTPSNINFGLFPPLVIDQFINGRRKKIKGKEKKVAIHMRARKFMDEYLSSL